MYNYKLTPKGEVKRVKEKKVKEKKETFKVEYFIAGICVFMVIICMLMLGFINTIGELKEEKEILQQSLYEQIEEKKVYRNMLGDRK